MNTTTILILNGIVAAGLLTALALVMVIGHRLAGSSSVRAAHWSKPLELELVRSEPAQPDLDKAA